MIVMTNKPIKKLHKCYNSMNKKELKKHILEWKNREVMVVTENYKLNKMLENIYEQNMILKNLYV